MAHCFYLDAEDLPKVPASDEVLVTAKQVIKFVRNHKYVDVEFKQVIGEKSLNPTLFPATKFAYAVLIIYSVVKKSRKLEKLVHSEQCLSVTTGISKTKVEKFEKSINVAPWTHLNNMHDMPGCMTCRTSCRVLQCAFVLDVFAFFISCRLL